MTPTQAPPTANPYVGPRAFGLDEPFFFGRDREVHELTSLLLAERVVFLTAPSGAGKTSLIQAGLIPRVRQRFHVLPVARLNAPGAPPGANRYLFSALQSLAGGATPTEGNLEAFLRARAAPPPGSKEAARGVPRPLLLVFDQFEEALTLDPYDRDAKQEFFAELGRVLRRDFEPADGGLRPRWALFALRDEYYAAFTPYLRLLPPGLGVSYRLDLLDERAAREAMVKPAVARGFAFAGDPGTEPMDSEAAVWLVNRLRRVRSPRPASQEEGAEDSNFQSSGEVAPGEVLAPSVEPVLLQVVCHRLWEKLTGDGRPAPEITLADVSSRGLVDNALGAFYAAKVKEVVARLRQEAPAAATTPPPDEWAVRRWFERRLINERGARGLVVQGSAEFNELGERAVKLLVGSYLVREDVRQAGVLYELAHDRLIGPVLRDNKPWREKYQGFLQVRAKVWEDKGSPDDAYLLSESELEEAEEWERANGPLMTERDRLYLKKCQDYRQKRATERHRKQKFTYRVVIAVAAVVVAILGVLSYKLYRANRRADKLIEVLDERKEMANALEQASADPEQSLRRAREHFARLHDLRAPAGWPGGVPPQAEEAWRRGLDIVHRALHESRVRATWGDHEREVDAVAYDGSGRRLVSVGTDLRVIIRDADSGAPVRAPWKHDLKRLPDDTDPEVTAVAFDPRDDNRLATATSQGAFLWTLPPDPGQPPQPRKLPDGKPGLNAIAVDRQGDWVAAAGDEGVVQVWGMREGGGPAPRPREFVHGDKAKVYGLAFGPAGWLASAGTDGTVKLWRATAEDGKPVHTLESPTRAGFRGVAFSADGRRLAAAGEDGTARVWEMQEGQPPRLQWVLYASPDRVNAVAFSHDRQFQLLATAGRDRLVKVWDVSPTFGALLREGAPVPFESRVPLAVLTGHDSIVTGVAFSPRDYSLASSSDDKTIKVWNISGGSECGCFVPISLRRRDVRRATLSPDGRMFASAWGSAAGGGVQVWKVGADVADWELTREQVTAVTALAYSHDNRLLAVGSDAGRVTVWDAGRKEATPSFDATLEGQSVTGLAFDPTGRWLAACTGCQADETKSLLAVWDRHSPGKEPLMTWVHPKIVFGVSFDPWGLRVATACNDRTARVWDVADLRAHKDPAAYEPEKLEKVADPGTFYEVAFSPDGKRLAAACADGATRVWALSRPNQAPAVLKGHEQGARCVAFDPQGRRLVTGGYDKMVRVWDLEAPVPGEGREPLYTFSGPAGTISELRFLGDRVAAVSFDRTVRFYDLDYDKLLRRVDDHLKAAASDPGAPDSR